MRVALDAFWWAEGPISNRSVMQHIVRGWIEQYPDDEIHLITTADGRRQILDELELPSRQVHRVVIPQHGLSVLYEYPFHLAKIKPQFALSQNFLPVGAGRKVVPFVHDMIFEDHPEWFTWPERVYFAAMARSLRKATRVLTSTQSEASRLQRILPGCEVGFTGLGVTSELANAIPEKPNLPLVEYGYSLIVGRLNSRKNLNFGLEALLQGAEISPERPVVVVGEADGKALERQPLVRQLASDGTAIFAGYLKAEHLAWLYKYARALVFPTRAEGFGLPVIEGRFFGAPLILSDISVLREVSGSAASTFIDLDDLRRAADSVSRHAYRSNCCGDSGSRELLLDQYSWPDVIDTMRLFAVRPRVEGGTSQ